MNEQQPGMNGQPPDMSGESENEGHRARPGQDAGRKFTNEDRSNNITPSDTSTQGQTEVVYTAEIYIKMALCILVLAAGLIFAMIYRKY